MDKDMTRRMVAGRRAYDDAYFALERAERALAAAVEAGLPTADMRAAVYEAQERTRAARASYTALIKAAGA